MPLDLKSILADGEVPQRDGDDLVGLDLSGTYGTVVNVLGYGAVGNGSTDDSAAIAAALAVVNASGGVLYFPAGKTFKVAASLNITHDDVTVWGYGSTLDVQKDGTATGRSLKATGADRVKILGLRLICSNAAARNQLYGILSLFSCTDFTIRDVVITSGEGTGIFTSQCQRGSIAGCRITGVKADGIHLSRETLDVNVTGCHVDGVADDAIAVASVENDGATFYDPCARIAISDCTVKDLVTLGSGIAVNGGNDITVTGSIVENPIAHGFQVDGGQSGFHPANRVSLTGCHARDIDAAKYGFNIATAIDTNIIGCTARDIDNPCIIVASTRTLVSSCNFEGVIGVYDDATSTATYAVGNYLEGSGTPTALNGTGSIAVTRDPQPKDSDLTDLSAKWVTASSAAPASLAFHEDTDNGSNKATVTAPSALGGDRTLTLPDATGTLITGAQADAAYTARASLSRADRATRSSGNLTLNNTSWTDVDTGLDLDMTAASGDWVLVFLSALAGSEAVDLFFDAWSVVSGSAVNAFSGDGGATGKGYTAWCPVASSFRTQGGGLLYQLVSGDISAGAVKIRLRYRTGTAANRSLFASSTAHLMFSAVNLG